MLAFMGLARNSGVGGGYVFIRRVADDCDYGYKIRHFFFKLGAIYLRHLTKHVVVDLRNWPTTLSQKARRLRVFHDGVGKNI